MAVDKRSLPLLMIEGSISAGKTTLCKHFETHSGGRVVAFEEQVNQKFLALFYDELNNADTVGNRYAFAFQLHMFEARSNANLLRLDQEQRRRRGARVKRPSLVLLDRSLVGDFVFCAANYLSGGISDAELDVYLDIAGCAGGVSAVHRIFETRYAGKRWHYVYLHSSYDQCKARAELRGGVESRDPIDLWYYELLEQVYFNVLLHLRAHYPSRVFVSVWRQYSANQAAMYDRTLHLCQDKGADAAPSGARASSSLDTSSPHDGVCVDEAPDGVCVDEAPDAVLRDRLARVGVRWYSRAHRSRVFEQLAGCKKK